MTDRTCGTAMCQDRFLRIRTMAKKIPDLDPERSSTLVMALMLGPSGANLVQQFAGEAGGTGPSRSAYWGEMVTERLPRQLLGSLTDRIRKRFLQRFAARQGASVVLRAVPFGVGAVL